MRSRPRVASYLVLIGLFTILSLGVAMTTVLLSVPPAVASPVVIGRPIAVGDYPTGVAVNETTNRVYVANSLDRSVSVIDGATGAVIGSPIAVGSAIESSGPLPTGVAVNEITNRVYVTDGQTGSVSVIDGATGAVIGDPIKVGDGPVSIAANGTTNRIYVANFLLGANGGVTDVSVINGATSAVIGSPVAVGDWWGSVAVNESTNRVYVGSGNYVSVIDGATGAVIGEPIASSTADNIAVNEVTDHIFVVDGWEGLVRVIDGATGMVIGSPAHVGEDSGGIAVNEVMNRAYVTNRENGTLSVIDGAAIVVIGSPIAAGAGADRVAVNQTTGRVYVANRFADTVTVIQDSPMVSKASITRRPARSRVTYRRRRGVAKFTLSAVVSVWGQAAPGRTVYLQSSRNGRSWNSTYRLRTNAVGRATRSFRVTSRRVRHYRWYVPAKSQVCLKTYSKSTKVTVR